MAASPPPSGDLYAPVGQLKLSDQVYERLKNAISCGELQPGERLGEQEIARRMSISQAPVREALLRLTRERVVLQIPRKGSFVAEISEQEARDAYQVRIPLERLAARLACAQTSPEFISALETNLDHMRAAAAADDLRAMIEADMSFHRRVWQVGGNPLMAEIWAMVEGCMRGFTLVSNRLFYTDLTEIAETHAPLIEALRIGDAEVAAKLFEAHAATVWDRVDSPTEVEASW